MPGRAMAAGADCELEVVLAREPNGGRDFVLRSRADDDCRAPVVDRVPEPARIVVYRVGRRDDLACKRVPEGSQLPLRESGGRSYRRRGPPVGGSGRHAVSPFSLRQPPARLCSMISRNIAVSAPRLIRSPLRIEICRPVSLPWPAVMIPSGSDTSGS